MMSHTRKSYSLAFKVQAVERYLENDCSLKSTADELQVHPATMQHWIKKGIDELRRQASNMPSADKDHRVKKLEKEVARLAEENDILRKAARMFAAQG